MEGEEEVWQKRLIEVAVVGDGGGPRRGCGETIDSRDERADSIIVYRDGDGERVVFE